jgi:hypothetical protein
MPYTLPEDHPQRRALNDEVHARPPEFLLAPVRLSLSWAPAVTPLTCKD